MGDGPSIFELSLALRGGAVLVLLLMAASLLRDAPRAPAARLGALFALGAAAYAICSTRGFHERAGLWASPMLALAVGNNLVFWQFARALFDDTFRSRPLYGLVWLALAAAGVVAGLGLAPAAAQPWLGTFLGLQALVFAGLAVVQTVGGWAGDLVEPRRRLRVLIVAGSAAHIAATALAGLSPRLDRAPGARLVDALVLAVMAAAVAWSLMRTPSQDLFGGDRAAATKPGDAPPLGADPADAVLLRKLEHAMTVERAYRQDGLTIGQLAHRLDTPEYRLRRVINRDLGQRNFAAYLNGYRLAEARAALADRSQDEVPILTIALDAGFGSLGPFNRAFKAETGMTPSAFRRAAQDGADLDAALPSAA